MRCHLLTSSVMVAVLSLALSGCSGTPKNATGPDANSQTDQTASSAAPFSSDKNSDKDGAAKTEKQGFLGADSSSAVSSTITVPAGTVLNVRLQQTVSSASALSGESFDAELDEPIVVNGQTVVPRGAQVTGRVVEAKSSGHLHDSGYLRLTLASITLDGKQVPIETSSLFAKGANHNRRNLALIGGGTGAGALIGGLAGGGKGALIGGLVGAGAGTTGAYATGKKDVAFRAERRLSFRLTQPFTAKG